MRVRKLLSLTQISDIICYSVGFAAEGEPVENALHSAKVMIRSIVDSTKASSYRVFLTGNANYREDLATIQKYKGNRTASKPTHYGAIREYLETYHNAEVVNGMEADDMLGIIQTKSEPHTTVICSIDKDLDMIAGDHYNWRRGEHYTVTQQEADLFFMKQLITGDRVDNIKGLVGFGEAKAKRIIESSEDMSDLYWNILEEYAKQYEKPYHALMETANLLWIQREEGVLWNSNMAELATPP